MQTIENYLTKEGWKNDWNETKKDARNGLETLVKAAKKPVDLYRNNKLVNLNVNVLAASYPSIAAAAYTSEIMEKEGFCDFGTSVGAGIVDWAAFIPIHILLHYKSKRHQFTNENDKLDKKKFWKDVRRVYKTQLPSIALFYAMAGPIQYTLMKDGMDGESANLLSYWGTLIATRALHSWNYYHSHKKD